MDYHMPNCNGLEAIIKIRELEVEHNVPKPVFIVSYTADVSEISKRELLTKGANLILGII